MTDYRIDGKGLWARDIGKNIDEMAKEIKIKVTHVDAHANEKHEVSRHDDIVGKPSKTTLMKLQGEWQTEQLGVQN